LPADIHYVWEYGEEQMTPLNDPLLAAQSLRETILKHRKETEETRSLAPQIVEGLIETGLCRLVVPSSLGGHEAAPVRFVQTLEELASAEASVAWIVWNNALPCFSARHLSEAPRREIFSDPRRLFASSTRPSGKAVITDGGFRVSGRWSLVSGCELADWIPVMCVVIEGEGPRMLAPGIPETRMAYIPKGSYTILDTWYVGGLRGSGSHDIVVDDEFVSAEKTYFFLDPDRLDVPISRLPFGATMSAGCAAICLGMAQTALDTLLDLASSKKQVDPTPGLRDRPSVQALIATAAAELDSARLLLHAALDDVWASCQQGSPVTSKQRARVWGSALHAARKTKAVVTAVYEAAGVSALYVDCPIERIHRDIHAVAQHIVLAPMWLEEAGRVIFGFESRNPIFSS
jgi:alkylation response protein AidB-like acyl-CoA dehydrogenase